MHKILYGGCCNLTLRVFTSASPPETPCSGFREGSGSENPQYQVGIDIGCERILPQRICIQTVLVVTAENIRIRGNKPAISFHGFFNTNVWGSYNIHFVQWNIAFSMIDASDKFDTFSRVYEQYTGEEGQYLMYMYARGGYG